MSTHIKTYRNNLGLVIYFDKYLFRVKPTSTPDEFIIEYHSNRYDQFMYIGYTIRDASEKHFYVESEAMTIIKKFINERGFYRYE